MEIPVPRFSRRKSGWVSWLYSFNYYKVMINLFSPDEDYFVAVLPQSSECPRITCAIDGCLISEPDLMCYWEKDRDRAMGMLQEAFDLVEVLNKGPEYMLSIHESE